MFKQTLKLISEGGNVFSGLEGETDKILREDIEPTINKFAKEFKKVFPALDLDFTDTERVIRLGSVGKKDISGDIDLGLDSQEFINENGEPKFEILGFSKDEYQPLFDKFKKAARTATDQAIMLRTVLTLMSKQINSKSKLIVSSDKDVGSAAIFNSFPQFTPQGKVNGKRVQIDVNIGPLSWLKFSYYSSGEALGGNLKGLHRTQLIAAIFDALGYQFRHEKGVLKDGQIVTTTVEGVIDLLKKNGIDIPTSDINDFNKIVDVIDKSPLKDEIYKAFLKGRLDSMRDSDVPDRMQDWWLANKEKYGMKGIWLPDNSELFNKMKPEEAARIRAERIVKDEELMAKKLAKAAK